jgi:hypothetical protein
MKTISTIFLILSATAFFAQPLPPLLELKSEIVAYYRLVDRATGSSNPKDFEALFNHPIYKKWGRPLHRSYAEALLKNNDLKNAEKYFLFAAETGDLNSTQFAHIFNMKKSEAIMGIVGGRFVPVGNIVGDYVIPRTPANMEFRENVLRKIQNIEQRKRSERERLANSPESGRIRDMLSIRKEAIGNELKEMHRRDQEIRSNGRTDRPDGTISRSLREVDSINVWRLIELIKDNPDIDVMSLNSNGTFIILLHALSHQAKAFTDFFAPYFRKQAEQGRGLYNFCFFYDLHSVRVRGSVSHYGFFGTNQTPFAVAGTSDEKNLDEINRNRFLVGLRPLKRCATMDSPNTEGQPIYLRNSSQTDWNWNFRP